MFWFLVKFSRFEREEIEPIPAKPNDEPQNVHDLKLSLKLPTILANKIRAQFSPLKFFFSNRPKMMLTTIYAGFLFQTKCKLQISSILMSQQIIIVVMTISYFHKNEGISNNFVWAIDH